MHSTSLAQSWPSPSIHHFVDTQYIDSIVNSLIIVLWSCVRSILEQVFGLCPCLGVGCAKKYAQ